MSQYKYPAFPLIFCFLAVSQVWTEVITYPAPQGETLSQAYTVTADGQPVDVYTARVNDEPFAHYDFGGPYGLAYFDFSGSVTVKITSQRPLDSVVIRPESYSVDYTLSGDTLIFQLTEPRKLSIEPDGRNGPLLLFTNAPEENPPKEGDPGVIWYGPGVHKPERIRVPEGQTLYIAGGAVVKGGVSINGDNARVMGRGILCGNDWGWQQGPGNMIGLSNRKNIEIRDIILRGSWSWTVVPRGCDSVTITNIKICGGRVQNDDGINPCNSQHVTIRDCFLRTDDDCIAMKGINFDADNDNVEYITVENSILWCDRARIFLLGHESRAEYMRHITLRNLDIIHVSMTPFLFEPGEEMSIEDVRVEDVRINAEYYKPEDYMEHYSNWDFITLRPVVNQYMWNQVPGKISNIYFKNVALDGDREDGGYSIFIHGTDADHMVTDVTFENVTWFGQLLEETSPQVRIDDYTRNIRFLALGVLEPQSFETGGVTWLPGAEGRLLMYNLKGQPVRRSFKTINTVAVPFFSKK